MTKDEVIVYCRANSMRRCSVLGWAQINCPLAYDEWRLKAPKIQGLQYWMAHISLNTEFHSTNPDEWKRIFAIRENDLKNGY